MYYKINTIQEVGHSFEVINNSIAVISTVGDCYIYESDFRGKNTMFVGGFSDIGAYSNFEFFLNNGFASKLVDINSLMTEDFSFKIDAIYGNRVISSEKVGKERHVISRLKDGKIEWNISLKFGKFLLLDSNYLYNTKYLDDGIINSYDSSTGVLKWTFNVARLGTWKDYDGREKATEISRILGTYKDQLYICLNSGKILVLNIETGEKIIVISNDKNTNQGSFYGIFMKSIELDKENGKLIQLFNQRYTEVELSTYNVKQVHLDDLNEKGLENMAHFVFDSDYIYFTDQYHHILGALNRITLKIDWTYKFPQDDVNCEDSPRYGRDLKLRDGRLYVLDNKNTLHIFEREVKPSK